jgi:hypothetical protein
MRTKRIFRNATLALLTIFAAVSCNDIEEELAVLTDVYVINKKFDNEVKSANAYYAYASESMLKVTVSMPDNTDVVELESYSGATFTMEKEPNDAEYKTMSPVDGSYVFTIQGYNGEMLQVPDILSYEGIDIPEFTKTKFSGTPLILELEWNDVNGADGYVVKMFDASGKLIFNGYSVGSDVNKYTVTNSSNSGFWSTPVVEGQSYLLQLRAFSYDADATASNAVYNISEISIGETQITWGVN